MSKVNIPPGKDWTESSMIYRLLQSKLSQDFFIIKTYSSMQSLISGAIHWIRRQFFTPLPPLADSFSRGEYLSQKSKTFPYTAKTPPQYMRRSNFTTLIFLGKHIMLRKFCFNLDSHIQESAQNPNYFPLFFWKIIIAAVNSKTLPQFSENSKPFPTLL